MESTSSSRSNRASSKVTPQKMRRDNLLDSKFRETGSVDTNPRSATRIIETLSQELGPDHPTVADSILEHALSIYSETSAENAVALLNRAKSIYLKEYGIEDINKQMDSQELSKIAFLKGSIFLSNGKANVAQDFFEEACSMRIRLFGPQTDGTEDFSDAVAESMEAYGNCMLQNGRLYDSIDMVAETYLIRSRRLTFLTLVEIESNNRASNPSSSSIATYRPSMKPAKSDVSKKKSKCEESLCKLLVLLGRALHIDGAFNSSLFLFHQALLFAVDDAGSAGVFLPIDSDSSKEEFVFWIRSMPADPEAFLLSLQDSIGSIIQPFLLSDNMTLSSMTVALSSSFAAEVDGDGDNPQLTRSPRSKRSNIFPFTISNDGRSKFIVPQSILSSFLPYDESMKTYNMTVSLLLDEIAVTFSDMEKHDLSIYSYLASYFISRRILETNDSDLAAIIFNMAQESVLMGDCDACILLFEKCIEIRTVAFGEKHALVASTLNIAAQALADFKQYTRSISYFNSVLRIREATSGPDHPDVAVVLNNLSNMLYKLNLDDEAAACTERALAILSGTSTKPRKSKANLDASIHSSSSPSGNSKKSSTCYPS